MDLPLRPSNMASGAPNLAALPQGPSAAASSAQAFLAEDFSWLFQTYDEDGRPVKEVVPSCNGNEISSNPAHVLEEWQVHGVRKTNRRHFLRELQGQGLGRRPSSMEPEASQTPATPAIPSDLQARMKAIEQQVCSLWVLNNSFVPPRSYEHLSDAIEQGTIAGVLSFAKAAELKQINRAGNQAKHHNLGPKTSSSMASSSSCAEGRDPLEGMVYVNLRMRTRMAEVSQELASAERRIQEMHGELDDLLD